VHWILGAETVVEGIRIRVKFRSKEIKLNWFNSTRLGSISEVRFLATPIG
jgi:hypothetical protein